MANVIIKKPRRWFRVYEVKEDFVFGFMTMESHTLEQALKIDAKLFAGKSPVKGQTYRWYENGKMGPLIKEKKA